MKRSRHTQILELKKERIGHYRYLYSAVNKNGKIITTREDLDGFVVGLVMKNYKHPYPYSLTMLLKDINNIGKTVKSRELMHLIPFGIAIIHEQTELLETFITKYTQRIGGEFQNKLYLSKGYNQIDIKP